MHNVIFFLPRDVSLKEILRPVIRIAERLGYRRPVLWTNDVLHAARQIYETRGFRLTREEPHHSFGHDLVGQYRELDLRTDDHG